MAISVIFLKYQTHPFSSLKLSCGSPAREQTSHCLALHLRFVPHRFRKSGSATFFFWNHKGVLNVPLYAAGPSLAALGTPRAMRHCLILARGTGSGTQKKVINVARIELMFVVTFLSQRRCHSRGKPS